MDAETLAALAPGDRIQHHTGCRYTLKERQRRQLIGWELETSDYTHGGLWVADADMLAEFDAVSRAAPTGNPTEAAP